MRIYVDFDDVICETARFFSALVKKMFNKNIPYGNIVYFNLQKSFGLTDDEYLDMMNAAHTKEALLSYEETPGAVSTLNSWLDKGHDVQIVTGRPFSSSAASKDWLRQHGLERLPIIFVDKYGREQPLSDSDLEQTLTVEEFSKLHFDFAVEDSPSAFGHLKRIENCRVAVYDRPWNAKTPLEKPQFERCGNWREIELYLQHAVSEKQ